MIHCIFFFLLFSFYLQRVSLPRIIYLFNHLFFYLLNGNIINWNSLIFISEQQTWSDFGENN